MRLRGFLALLISLAVAGHAWAQSQITTGVIQGTVRDSAAGTALSGVTIAIVGTRRGTTTGETGRFELPDLVAGLYVVRVRQLGYATEERSAIVRGGETTTVAVRLVSTPVTLAAVRARATAIPLA